PGCTLWLYQLSPSTPSTQNTWIAPASSFPPSARIIPASSYSKKRPMDVGKTRIGCPACPYTSDSISRPNSWLYCLLYSRFMCPRILTELPGLRHLPVFNAASSPIFNSQFARLCHPERSEGSALRRKMQIPRFARDDNS